MRNPGQRSELLTVLLPIIVLAGAVVLLNGDPDQFFPTLERQLWAVVRTVGQWFSGLIS
jgi:hypothetical protein